MLKEDFPEIVSKHSTDIGRTKLHQLDIPVKGEPVAVKPYAIPLKYQSFIDEEVRKLEEAGLIQKSISDWNSPIIVVPK